MHCTIGLLIFLTGALNQAERPAEVAPVVVVEATKLANYSRREMVFEYQFEDDRWRTARISPNSTVYISHADPKNPLRIKFYCGQRWHDEELKTTGVHVAPRHVLPPLEQRARNDEAAPYHFRDENGGTHLFRGFHPDVVRAAAKSLFEALIRADVDVQLFATSLEASQVDPVILEAEFIQARSIITKVVTDALRTQNDLEIQLDWVPIRTNAGMDKVWPRFHMGACRRSVVAEFGRAVLRDMLHSKFAVSDPVLWVVECCAPAMGGTVRTPQLQQRYLLPGGGVAYPTIWSEVEKKMRRGFPLGVEHASNLDADTFHVCSQWKQTMAPRAAYRWKVKVIVSKAILGGKEVGVGVHTNIVAEKKSNGSASWRRVADFVVAQMSEFTDTDLRESPHLLSDACRRDADGKPVKIAAFSGARSSAYNLDDSIRALLVVPTPDEEAVIR
jgi:hypothetical protein